MSELHGLLDSWDLHLHDKAQSTRGLYRDCLLRFARWLPEGTSVLEATRQHCQAYFAGMKAQGLAQATLRSRWVALRSFYGFLAEEDEIPVDPMAKVKVAKADPPPPSMPTDEDLGKLLKVCAGRGIWERRDLAMIRTAAASGLRIGELCALNLGDLDLKSRVVVVRHGKGDKFRVSRFDRETGATIDRYLRTRAKHRLGHLPELWINRFGAMGVKGAQAMLKRRCQQADIAHVPWHRLRHRFAHTWLAAGGNEGDLRELGGWTDPAVMRRYGRALAVERSLAAYDEIGHLL